MNLSVRKLLISMAFAVFAVCETAQAGVAGHGAAASREAEAGPGVSMTQAAQETEAETAAAETSVAAETAAAEETG